MADCSAARSLGAALHEPLANLRLAGSLLLRLLGLLAALAWSWSESRV